MSSDLSDQLKSMRFSVQSNARLKAKTKDSNSLLRKAMAHASGLHEHQSGRPTDQDLEHYVGCLSRCVLKAQQMFVETEVLRTKTIVSDLNTLYQELNSNGLMYGPPTRRPENTTAEDVLGVLQSTFKLVQQMFARIPSDLTVQVEGLDPQPFNHRLMKFMIVASKLKIWNISPIIDRSDSSSDSTGSSGHKPEVTATELEHKLLTETTINYE